MVIFDPIIINKANKTLKWYYKYGDNEKYKNKKYCQYRNEININETLIDLLIDAKTKQISKILNSLDSQYNYDKIALIPLNLDNAGRAGYSNVNEAYNAFDSAIKINRNGKKLLFIDSQYNEVLSEIKRIDNGVEFEFFAKPIKNDSEKSISNITNDNKEVISDEKNNIDC